MRLGIRVFSLISHADPPRLIKEIEILVRDNDLKGVVRHDPALYLYRYRIADGVESDSQGYDYQCNDDCSRPYKQRRYLPDDVTYLLTTQLNIVYIIVLHHVSSFSFRAPTGS